MCPLSAYHPIPCAQIFPAITTLCSSYTTTTLAPAFGRIGTQPPLPARPPPARAAPTGTSCLVLPPICPAHIVWLTLCCGGLPKPSHPNSRHPPPHLPPRALQPGKVRRRTTLFECKGGGIVGGQGKARGQGVARCGWLVLSGWAGGTGEWWASSWLAGVRRSSVWHWVGVRQC